ncbi:MAG: glycosyltransferase [Thermoanaerobaculia bacterium]
MNPRVSIGRFLGRRPLDWGSGAGRPPVARPDSIDVVIPVYHAAAELAACLRSVVRETDLTRHRLLLVVDGPQPLEVDTVLGSFEAEQGENVRIVRNDRRLGFVGTANRGMRETRGDVVLLNSDTVVTARWLEKLVDAAYSSADVGTVTPLSNNATICSVPRGFEENLLPTGHDVASFAALVERVSARAYPRIPSGVGVCFYVRRALIDDIGVFDEERFGLGYGEENDFCLRALERGWLNVADDATFIYHAGHRSFGAARERLERLGAAALRKRHPRYIATIAEAMRNDPLSEARERISLSLGLPDGAAAARRVVHLVHGWPPFQQAGTEMYAWWLARRQRVAGRVAVYTRGADPSRADGEAVELADEGIRVRIVTNNFASRNPLRRNAISDGGLERDFERFLREEQPDLLHVHHLAGHTFSLVRVARRLGVPVVMQIQDWWFLCARVNFFDSDGNRCTGPAPEKCASCATLTKLPPSALTNRAMHAERRAAAHAALEAADAFIAGSRAIRDDYLRWGSIPEATPFHVLPYGVALEAPSKPRREARRPIRFGYVGSISPHKGLHVAVDAMRDIDPSGASLHIWGNAAAFPDYVAELERLRGPAAVVFEGRFREEDKAEVYSSMDVLIAPSIGLESFGLAPREAMVCGVPVVATSGGALDEMFDEGECGELVPVGDAAALRAVMRRIVDDPSIVDRWSARVPVPTRDDDHAREIERVYEEVLAGRTR